MRCLRRMLFFLGFMKDYNVHCCPNEQELQLKLTTLLGNSFKLPYEVLNPSQNVKLHETFTHNTVENRGFLWLCSELPQIHSGYWIQGTTSDIPVKS